MMQSSSFSAGEWERTNLCLTAQNHSSSNATTTNTIGSSADYYLYLPPSQSSHNSDGSSEQQRRSTATSRRRLLLQYQALDRYLASLPQLAASTQQLLSAATPPNIHHHHKVITTSSNSGSGRVINVLQGEMAHCTPTQADILVSDDATTCHILGLWSRRLTRPCHSSNGSSGAQPNEGREAEEKDDDANASYSDNTLVLATVAHIDCPDYQDCIKKAVDLHYQYHSSQLSHQQQQQQQQQQRTQPNGNDTNILPVIELHAIL